MNGYAYAHDKPGDCRECFFHDGCRSKCRLGKGNCYYLIAVDAAEEFPCDTCPYHREEVPCIGYCLAEIVNGVLGKRDYAILLLGAELGLKAAEIVNLMLENHDPERGTIMVRNALNGKYTERRLWYLPTITGVQWNCRTSTGSSTS